MEIMTPAALKPGDTVALIAPARAVTPEETADFEQWCQNHHLTLLKGEHLYGRHHQFSGTAQERAADLLAAWNNEAVKAVFCARGGYGCVQVLDLCAGFDWMQKPKWLVGFSDVTTLHLHLNKLGMATLHGPMPIHWCKKTEDMQRNIDQMERSLFQSKVEINIDKINTENKITFEGIVVGGNLSLIYAALGTPEQPDTEGKILFIEDLDEYLYHIDRMMMALKRAGLLHGLKALLVGGMTEMRDNAVPFGYTAEEIITGYAKECGFPVLFDFPAGHSSKNNCIKLGAHCTFDGEVFTQP
jgi:muramoyltetrapeptide carboxypeptidase